MTTPLPLPNDLKLLISDGLWPDKKSAQMQNLRPLILKEIVHQFAPDEETIFLYPPPFATIAEARKHKKHWEDKRNALDEIDPREGINHRRFWSRLRYCNYFKLFWTVAPSSHCCFG